MSKERIIEAYEDLAESYNAMIDFKPHNAYYDRPNTLKLLGDTKGKLILDAACGPGKYSEELLKNGAKIVGFDISPKMIDLAKERNKGNGKFFVHDLTAPLEMLEGETFDNVVCALAMHYVEDWTSTIKEFFRVLKPSGRLVISIEHPFFEYTYFKSEQYFDTEPVKATWTGFGKPVEVHSYRRSLHECIEPLTANGFLIDRIVEPKPVPEFEKLDPRHYKELNEFPAFLCLRGIKH